MVTRLQIRAIMFETEPHPKPMTRTRAVLWLALLLAIPGRAQITLATIGDSFADALYLSMRVRPDLLKQHSMKIVRWSRAKIGLTRMDLFDYPAWLRETQEIGSADVCVVQIGSNDLQSILISKLHWAAFGSDKWKSLYADRTAGMFDTLRTSRCKQVAWLLQPGFEKREFMARGQAVVSQVQAGVMASSGGIAFDVVTTKDDYQFDNIHYNRDFMLRMGPALIRLAEASKEIVDGKCLGCHSGSMATQVFRARDLSPLRVHQQ
jgi:hypothetical protein